MDPAKLNYALNAIQWINVKEDPNDPNSADLWRYADPTFVAEYPDVLKSIRDAGFDSVMMEVLDTQTLQNYEKMLKDADLKPAPGYLQIQLPSDHGVTLEKGSNEWIHWFDLVRRRAEESNYMGLDTLFIAPEVDFEADRTTKAAAVGLNSSKEKLDELIEILTESARILNEEGIRPGLHNHVGTWLETEDEIDYVLERIPAEDLGVSFDIGHLEWAGINAKEMIKKYSDRIVDLHIKDLDLDIAADSRENPAPYRTTADRGIFLEPGLGQVDLIGALSELPDDFTGTIIVEVDKASMDPDESAKVTANWLKELKAK